MTPEEKDKKIREDYAEIARLVEEMKKAVEPDPPQTVTTSNPSDWTGWYWWWPHSGVCPHCGRCPTCGRPRQPWVIYGTGTGSATSVPMNVTVTY